MKNYTMIDDNNIQTPFGMMGGVIGYSCYTSGELESVKLSENNMIVTHCGEIVPAYNQTHRRKNKPSVEFHKNGLVRSVAMEKQQEIVTPIGELPAEMVTFYPSGELHRVFPLDGQISGFWTEEEEKKLGIPLTFDVGFSVFTAVLNGICFYKNGEIKSVTLYPGEKAVVRTPCGTLETGVGFSLYESGLLQSTEPSVPFEVKTPIGKIMAYDPNAIAVTADVNSLRFDEEGRISSLITTENKILVQTEQEQMMIFSPVEKIHPLNDEATIRIGLKVSFDYDKNTVTIVGEKENTFSIRGTGFTIQHSPSNKMSCSPADCASCSLCKPT